MREEILMAWLPLILSAIFYLFWYNQWRYSLPTPVPANYHPAQKGTNIKCISKLFAGSDKPVFMHFFNPACPCSKFNIPRFKSLVKMYDARIYFAVVVISNSNKYKAAEIQDEFNLRVPVLFDKAIADSCGVYSTPRAVMLDHNHNLYYRGNYNRNRYCTNSSNYAQIAIESLLAVNYPVALNKNLS